MTESQLKVTMDAEQMNLLSKSINSTQSIERMAILQYLMTIKTEDTLFTETLKKLAVNIAAMTDDEFISLI